MMLGGGGRVGTVCGIIMFIINFHIAMETVLDGSCLQQKGESDCEAHCLIFLHMTRAISYA